MKPSVIALLYAVIGALWIIFSSYLLSHAVESPWLRQQLELIKGLLFIGFTSGLLYVVLLRSPQRTGLQSASVRARSLGLVGIIIALLLLVPLIGYGIISFSVPAVEKHTYNNLQSITNHQLANVRLWTSERTRDLHALLGSRTFVDAVAALANPEDRDRAAAEVADRLQPMLDTNHYTSAVVLDSEGNPRQIVGDPQAALPGNVPARMATLPDDQALWREIHVTDGAEPVLYIDFIGRLTEPGQGGGVAGYLLIRHRPEESLLQQLRNVPAPLRTLETLLVRADDNGALVVPLSQQEGGEQDIMRLPLTADRLIGNIAAEGPGEGLIEGLDNRGKQVLAFFYHPPNSDWIMIAKVDRAEALAPVRTLALWVSALTLAAVLTLMTMLALLWRQQRRNYDLSLVASSAEHERALREREQVYRELFRANPHPMWVYRLDNGKLLDVNEAAVVHYGYSREEFMAMRVGDLLAADDEAESMAPPGRDKVHRHQRSDGSIIHVETSCHRLRFDDFDAELMAAYDISELMESTRFITATLDSLSFHICVLDETGVIIAVNRNWRQFATENGGDYIHCSEGANYLEVCRRAAAANSDAATVVHALDEILNGDRETFLFEYSCHSPTEKRWFLIHITRFPRNGALRVVVAHENITQRKIAEFELRKLNRYYEALSAMNGAIIRAREPRQMLRQICKIAATHTDLELVSVARMENDEVMPGYATYGPSMAFEQEARERLEKQVVSSGPIKTFEPMSRGETVIIDDFLNNPETRRWADLASAGRLKSVLAAPIKCRDGLWGEIVFFANRVGYFTSDLVNLLEELTADVAYSLDMLELQRRQQEAEAQLVLNARIIESTHEGLFITDNDNRITMVNQAMTAITGYSRDELLGNHPQMLQSGHHNAAFYAELWKTLEETGRWEGEIWDRRKNGEVFPARLSITRVAEASPSASYHIAIYRDVTERKAYESRIEHLANHDLLTDLPNRLLLEDRTAVAIEHANRNGDKLAVLFIDLDNFKLVNDTLGHELGDKLLKIVASRLVGVLRSADTVCRVGGDEFVALLTGMKAPGDAALVAEKIVSAISAPLRVDEHELIITASVGIAIHPENGDNLEELARLADVAMLNAKRSGQDRYRFYSGEMGEDAGKHLKLLNELRGACSRNELFLVYQPQYHISEKRVIGVESLARWSHPEFGLVSPAQFIPVAEDSGQIIQIGRWVMTEACRQMESWRQQGLADFPVAVNVSVLQFRQTDFVEMVEQVLRDTGLPASYLELEVTESVLMTDADDVVIKLDQLRSLGVKLAIDDFGTGYSSLSYLRQFSTHRLKIDKSFIRDLPDNQDAVAITNAVVSMGITLGMEIIAEGVETREQEDYLVQVGCQFGQGFLFGHPMTAGKLESWLAEIRQS